MKNRNLTHADDWATPPEFYNNLNAEFNFTFDPCPYQHDLTRWDGLQIEWKERNFINPPYSRKLKEAFVLKAIAESKKGKLCVMLLPVSTSTQLFHRHILPNHTDIRFIEKRIKFLGINTKGEFVSNKAGMHDSMIVVFDGRPPQQRFKQGGIVPVGGVVPGNGIGVINELDIRRPGEVIITKSALRKLRELEESKRNNPNN